MEQATATRSPTVAVQAPGALASDCRPRDAGAVRSNAGIGIHHPVNSRDQHKRKPAPAGIDKARALPNGSPTVEIVPDTLSSGGDFFGRHYAMVPIQLGTKRLRDEPAPGQRNSCNGWRVIAQRLFPPIEIHGAGIRAQHYEL